MLQYILGVVLQIREISRNIMSKTFWLKRSFTFIMGVHICICVIILSVVGMQVFEEEALTWEEKLNRINALFDVWIDVQRRWVYLEGIFSGSADIKVLLPVETSRFQSIR